MDVCDWIHHILYFYFNIIYFNVPQEVLLAQFSLYVHKSGLKPDSFHFLFQCVIRLFDHFYPLPDEVGAGVIGVASDVRPSGRPSRVRMSAFRFRSRILPA